MKHNIKLRKKLSTKKENTIRENFILLNILERVLLNELLEVKF
jgi:hypothetical protein